MANENGDDCESKHYLFAVVFMAFLALIFEMAALGGARSSDCDLWSRLVQSRHVHLHFMDDAIKRWYTMDLGWLGVRRDSGMVLLPGQLHFEGGVDNTCRRVRGALEGRVLSEWR